MQSYAWQNHQYTVPPFHPNNRFAIPTTYQPTHGPIGANSNNAHNQPVFTPPHKIPRPLTPSRLLPTNKQTATSSTPPHTTGNRSTPTPVSSSQTDVANSLIAQLANTLMQVQQTGYQLPSNIVQLLSSVQQQPPANNTGPAPETLMTILDIDEHLTLSYHRSKSFADQIAKHKHEFNQYMQQHEKKFKELESQLQSVQQQHRTELACLLTQSSLAAGPFQLCDLE
jgi:hypothetical protein